MDNLSIQKAVPRLDPQRHAASEGRMTINRDIAHEQVSGSTTDQLRSRRAELEATLIQRGGLSPNKLAELHRIWSELYCRESGIKSEPWVTWAELRRGA